MWDREVDVLIFGSGAGGLAAGVFAAKKSLDTLICEKSSVIGGTTATSGGAVWIPGSDQAKAAGIDDPPGAARTYLGAELGNYFRSDLIDAYLESAPLALAELERGTEVKFDLLASSDYHPDQVGGSQGARSLMARRFDGRRLGRDFERIRPPIKRLLRFGGMMIGSDEIPDFLAPTSSPGALRRVVRRFLRHGLDRLTYSRGTLVSNGNALVCRLFYSLREAGVPVWTDAPLEELITLDGKALGAILRRDGRPFRVRARLGVILATGGFPHSAVARQAYAGNHPFQHSLAWKDNSGDGISAATKVGGQVDANLASPALWTPASTIKLNDGSEEAVIYGYLDRGRPGVVAVNSSGRRFVNESNSYHDIVMAMYDDGYTSDDRYYFVCDANFVRKCGLGAIPPFPLTLSLKKYVKSGYISVADSIEDLARQIDVDPSGLLETLKSHNEYAKTGVDLDFGKGSSSYNREFGDRNVHPNPNLSPVERAPFVALRIKPAAIGTAVGLQASIDGQVYGAQQTPIGGLYACGNDLASVMRGYYPAGGITLGPAITFAHRAIEDIVRSQKAD